jgi:hypothetical protein
LENIVQCEYCGCIEFYGFSREKGCLLELGVYMKNQYCRGKRTSWRNDVFRVAVSWEEDGSMVVERFWRK